MGQFAYRCITVSLAAGFAQPTPIPGAEPGNQITGVLVLNSPTGTQGSFQIGSGGDPMPLTQGLELDTDACDPMSQGVFITAPAQAGVSVQFVITYGTAAVASLGAL